MSCADPLKVELGKPSLYLKIRDDSGKVVPGATVRLYKDIRDSGITKTVDSTGLVIFSDLDIGMYYWFAQKGCKTNRISQVTIDRPFVPGAVYYGYSVLAETGTLKIINNAVEPYKISDSLFSITLNKDTPYIAHRRVRSYLIKIEKISLPGVSKDTLIRITCGDTTIISVPY